jgi:hypothetical protein
MISPRFSTDCQDVWAEPDIDEKENDYENEKFLAVQLATIAQEHCASAFVARAGQYPQSRAAPLDALG